MTKQLRNLAAALTATTLALAVLAVGAQGAAPAWSIVGATGPTVLPPLQSEVQRLAVDAEGGSFTLTAKRMVIPATGTGSYTAFSKSITGLVTNTGSFAIGQLIEGEGIQAGTTITAVAAGTLTLSKEATKSETNAALRSVEFVVSTTPPIPFNASAAELEVDLNGVSAISGAGGSVSVTGGPGGPEAKNPYTIAFGGTLENTNTEQLVTNATSLTGGGQSATMATIVEGGPGTTKLAVYGFNIGGYETEGTVTEIVHLPAGVTTTETPAGSGWTCSSGAGQSTFTCTDSAVVQPSLIEEPVLVNITSAPGANSGVINLEISGGRAKSSHGELPLAISSTPSEPGIQSFTAGAYDSNGNSDTQAGDHPYSASTGIFINTIRNPRGAVTPAGEFKDISVELPPGFLGNPIAVPQCPETTEDIHCPFPTMVGIALPLLQFGTGLGGFNSGNSAVFNTEAPLGYPAKFRFNVRGLVPLSVVGSLRSDSDYGLTAASLNTPQIKSVYGTFFTFWGAPAEESHNASRCNGLLTTKECGPPAPGDPIAFLTNAVNCAEQAISAPVTTLQTTLWQEPLKTFTTKAAIPAVTGCNKLHFEANFKFEPSGTKADSPASFQTELTVPEEGLKKPNKLTTPEINKTVVQLPKGVVLNASGATGLEACSESQIGLKNEIDPSTGLPVPLAMPNPLRFNTAPNRCPEASKIGTGELKTALLEEPLHGALYLASQGKGNPFGSLFAIYLVIEDPRHGIFIKLPGEVEPDPSTGQMTVSFENLPQVPFTNLKLSLKGGDHSALASPTTCGNYVTTATNTPWSAPESDEGKPVTSANGFDINEGPSGGACAKTPQERPFDLGWEAGAESTKAGASGPFNFRLTRPDGSQELETLQLNTPQGLSASLKGVPYCTEAEIKQAEGSTGKQEQEHPACPSASQVGTATTGAGSGPTPFYTSGKLYLAGPYKGAPISVVAVTPAVAGPFDLGNVVVRSAVFIDRSTAQVTAKTDPIPQILDGVVLRIKDVRIHLDRKDWTINPTSCEPSSVKLIAHGNSGAVAERSARFQVGSCSDLGFKPKLTGKVTGPTKRGDLPAFTAELTYPEGPGYANIKAVQVTLPHSEFLEQAHINTVCTRVQAAANSCPQGSIYGYAEATTPLIDGVLKGPVFLKSSVHKLPDLAIALKGPENQPVEVEFAGRIDSVHGQIRNTIEGLPDVPVSKFVLKMKGGKKGLLVNSRNLCQGTPGKMTVDMTAQNNKTSDSRPVLGNSCGKGKKKAKKHQGHKRLSRLLVGW